MKWHGRNENPGGSGDRYILMCCFAGLGALTFDFQVTQVHNYLENNEYCIKWAYCDELLEVDNGQQ